MATNIDKVLAKRAEEKRRADELANKGYRVTYWKPSKGDNHIRIMPPWTDEGENAGQFWREVFRHWNIGEGGYDEENGWSFTCPVQTPDGPGGECPICELVAELRASDNPADKEIAKEIRAKRRLYSNVVDLSDAEWTKKDVKEWEEENDSDQDCPFEAGDTKVQVWSYGQTVFKHLLDFFASGVDITDIEAGVNLTITREGKGINTEYRVTPDLKGASQFEVEGDLEKLIPNLDLLSPFPKDGDMERCLSGEIGSGKKAVTSGKRTAAPGLPAAEVEEEDDFVAEVATKAKAASKKKKNTTRSVDDIEAELMEELAE